MLEQLATGAYTCAADGQITYFNRSAVGMWGRTPRLNDPAELYCGSHRLYAVDGVPIDHAECWMALALRDRRPYQGNEILIERPDGQRLNAIAYASPLHDAGGELVGGVNFLFDVTHQKALLRRLETSERQRGQMLVGLACEIRAQLNPLRRTAQALSAMPADANTHDAVDVIDRQLRHITQLVDRLLNLESEADLA